MAFYNGNFDAWAPYHQIQIDWEDSSNNFAIDVFPASLISLEDELWFYGILSNHASIGKVPEGQKPLVCIPLRSKPYKFFREERTPKALELALLKHLQQYANSSVETGKAIRLTLTVNGILASRVTSGDSSDVQGMVSLHSQEFSGTPLPPFSAKKDKSANSGGGKGGWSSPAQIIEARKEFVVESFKALATEPEKIKDLIDVAVLIETSKQTNALGVVELMNLVELILNRR